MLAFDNTAADTWIWTMLSFLALNDTKGSWDLVLMTVHIFISWKEVLIETAGVTLKVQVYSRVSIVTKGIKIQSGYNNDLVLIVYYFAFSFCY